MEGTVRTIETSASPESVFSVAADIENYPEWASAVKSVEVLDRDEEDRGGGVAEGRPRSSSSIRPAAFRASFKG